MSRATPVRMEELVRCRALAEELRVRIPSVVKRREAADAIERLCNSLTQIRTASLRMADALIEGEDLHDPECPEDDTCECELACLVNKALDGWWQGLEAGLRDGEEAAASATTEADGG